MATTSIRWTACKALIDAVRVAIDDPAVSVEPGWPGELNMRADMIWVNEITSQIDIPVMTADRRHRDEKFTIEVLFRTSGRKSLDDTMTRLHEIYAVMEDVIADDSILDGLDGVVLIEIASADVSCGATTDGFVGFARTQVLVHSRLL